MRFCLRSSLPIAFFLCSLAAADEGTQVYGYFQGEYFHYTSTPFPQTSTTVPYNTNNGLVSQANIFLSKSGEGNISGFMNLEITNNFSSDRGWGTMNLQEAFVRYDHSDPLSLKFGYFIPTFNAMYEIYNRSPLLPYLVRPIMYETQYAQVTNIFSVLPEHGLLQLSGFVEPVSGLKFDYAAYIGNPANDFIYNSNNTDPVNESYIPHGQSLSRTMSGGGRLGLRWKDLTLGASVHTDYDNKESFLPFYNDTTSRSFGDLPRYGIGADLKYSLWKFTLTGEYYMSKTPISSAQKDSMAIWAALPNAQMGKDLDVTAYLATLQFDITDRAFAYISTDKFRDDFETFNVGIDGISSYTIGLGWHVTDDLVIKAQALINYSKYICEDPSDTTKTIYSTIHDKYLAAGFSYGF